MVAILATVKRNTIQNLENTDELPLLLEPTLDLGEPVALPQGLDCEADEDPEAGPNNRR